MNSQFACGASSRIAGTSSAMICPRTRSAAASRARTGISGLACASKFFGFFFTDEAGAGFFIHLRCRVVMGVLPLVLDGIFSVCAILEYFVGVELALARLRMLGGISFFGVVSLGLGDRVNVCDGYFRD